jgi:serine/threonine protein kinase
VQYKACWIESFDNTNKDQNLNVSDGFEKPKECLVLQNSEISILFIQMELCFSTLRNIIKKVYQDRSNRMEQVNYFISSELLIEILESVNYLHKQNPQIIHRDLKPANILLTKGTNGRFIKIADFGLATLHEFDEQSHTSASGTPKYMAREVLDGSKYDTKADIFSLGVIVQELFNFDINK